MGFQILRRTERERRQGYVGMLTSVARINRVISLRRERWIRPHIPANFVVDSVTYGIIFICFVSGPHARILAPLW